MIMKKQIYSVSSVNQYIKSLFMDDFALNNIYVRGEVSNCKYHTSGHIYFTLKDRDSAISCVMFSGNRAGLKFRMTEGMSVTVFGSIGVYERDGRYQLYASSIEQEGTGRLYEEFDALKNKLLAQGLFDAGHKKAVPPYPSRLGIVTAPEGAAVKDIINVSLRRDPWIQIIFCPARVQGEGAAQSVVNGIKALEAYGVDVMIVGRGGGSIEDLWAFNEEKVARAVYECSVPVISAVGHETDTTIIDYVSDLRAPTPSAAAELAVPDMRVVTGRIESYSDTLDGLMSGRVSQARSKLDHYTQLLKHMDPGALVNEKRQYLIEQEEQMGVLIDMQIMRAKSRLSSVSEKLEGLSPLRQLARGYAYVTDESGHGVTSASAVSHGSKLKIEVTDGEIGAQVLSVKDIDRNV